MSDPSQPRRKNVFVCALDDFHRTQFERIRDADRYAFHPLLSRKELFNPPDYPFEQFVQRAIAQLEAFDGPIDGIAGYWDFPTSDLVAVLCERYGLCAASVEATIKCEHKYWSRLEQRKAAPEVVPECHIFDPFDRSCDGIPLPYPYWVKPIKSFSSYLGFRVGNRRDLHRALERIQQEVRIIGEPFGRLMQRVDMPPEIAALGGTACMAEQIIGGRQCTAEGYVIDGEVTVFGVIDSIRGPNRTSFHRYQYPSRLPLAVQERVIDVTRRVIRQIGLDRSTFNIEYFYDAARDKIWLVEVNPRISQSHSEIFYLVDGAPNHQVNVSLSVGERPCMPHREGPYRVAAKFMPREYEDAVVVRVPTERDIARVEATFPGTRISLDVREGLRLSDLLRQDSYSYEMGAIYLGAERADDLLPRYDDVLRMLDIRLAPVDAPGVVRQHTQREEEPLVLSKAS